MTNSEKIMMEVIKNGIYTAAEVKKYLAEGNALPVHTAYEWNQLGYHIKKGEHARIVTKLWKMVPDSEETGEGEERPPQFYLADTHLFTIEQVEANAEVRLEVRQ